MTAVRARLRPLPALRLSQTLQIRRIRLPAIRPSVPGFPKFRLSRRGRRRAGFAAAAVAASSAVFAAGVLAAPVLAAVLSSEPGNAGRSLWLFLPSALAWLSGAAATLAVFWARETQILSRLARFARTAERTAAASAPLSAAAAKEEEPDGLLRVGSGIRCLYGALAAARRENRMLLERLAAAREEERRDIATEIHDEAGPCLFGIAANAQSVADLARSLPASAAQDLRLRTEEILALTARLRNMNRHLLAGLRPAVLGKVPLTALLSGLLAGFARRHPDVRFVKEFNLPERSYGEAVDLALYRAVQEGVTNALRHGKATAVIVTLREETRFEGSGRHGKRAGDRLDTQLVLSLRDNGRGGVPADANGNGLSIMRGRVAALGGTWAAGDNWPQGTVIRIALPVVPQARDTAAAAVPASRTPAPP